MNGLDELLYFDFYLSACGVMMRSFEMFLSYLFHIRCRSGYQLFLATFRRETVPGTQNQSVEYLSHIHIDSIIICLQSYKYSTIHRLRFQSSLRSTLQSMHGEPGLCVELVPAAYPPILRAPRHVLIRRDTPWVESPTWFCSTLVDDK